MKKWFLVLALLLVPMSGAYDYPDGAVNSFMNSCTGSCSKKVDGELCKTMCQCMIDQYQSDMSYEDFLSLNANLLVPGKKDEAMKVMGDYSNQCADKHLN